MRTPRSHEFLARVAFLAVPLVSTQQPGEGDLCPAGTVPVIPDSALEREKGSRLVSPPSIRRPGRRRTRGED